MCAIPGEHLRTRQLAFEETFAQSVSAVVACTVPGLSEFYFPVSFDLATLDVRHSRRTPTGLKLAIDKTFTQSRRAFL